MTLYLLVNAIVYLLILAGSTDSLKHLIEFGDPVDPVDLFGAVGSTAMLGVSLYLLFT